MLSTARSRAFALPIAFGAACAIGVLTSPSARAQVFVDNFDTIPNGQADPKWTNRNGANFIVTNPTGTAGTFDATNPNNNPLIIATMNGVNVTDFTFDFDIGAVRDGGAVARFQDANNFALLVVKAQTSQLYWHIMQNGTLSGVLSQVALPLTAGTAVHVSVTGTGSTLSGTVSQGQNFFTSTLNAVPFTSGGLGLYDYALGSGVPLRFDNVVVNGTVAAPEPASLSLLAPVFPLAGLACRVVRRRRSNT